MRLPIALLISAVLVAGCSQESKSDYHAAGQDLQHAAKETGDAMKKDAQIAAKATQNAANSAKATVKQEKAEHEKKSNK